MSDSYEINEHDEVVPYSGGRMSTDTRAWRDATELELQQRDEIESLRYTLQCTEELLNELKDYFDNYADVTDSSRGVAEVPNEALEWWTRINEVLEKKRCMTTK